MDSSSFVKWDIGSNWVQDALKHRELRNEILIVSSFFILWLVKLALTYQIIQLCLSAREHFALNCETTTVLWRHQPDRKDEIHHSQDISLSTDDHFKSYWSISHQIHLFRLKEKQSFYIIPQASKSHSISHIVYIQPPWLSFFINPWKNTPSHFLFWQIQIILVYFIQANHFLSAYFQRSSQELIYFPRFKHYESNMNTLDWIDWIQKCDEQWKGKTFFSI